MTDTITAPADAEETALLDQYARARREAREMWRERCAVRKTLSYEERAARQAGELLPDWHVRAATAIIDRVDAAYNVAIRAETAALAELSRYVDRKIAASAAAAARAADTAVTA